MIEESESGVTGAGAQSSAAIGVAMNAAAQDASAAADAREYLKKQSHLADLQVDTLQKKDEFEVSHLRFRRFSDYARFSLEFAGFLLALPKFGEASQYAPNWGRLHLKWGEALYYAGRKDEAKKQFEVASHFDLSKADSAALARMRPAHG